MKLLEQLMIFIKFKLTKYAWVDSQGALQISPMTQLVFHFTNGPGTKTNNFMCIRIRNLEPYDNLNKNKMNDNPNECIFCNY